MGAGSIGVSASHVRRAHSATDNSGNPIDAGSFDSGGGGGGGD